MTQSSVSNYLSVLKQQAVLQETLVGYNSKAQGMLELILDVNWADHLPNRARAVHDALCAICEMVTLNRGLSETILDLVLNAITEVEDQGEVVGLADS